MQVSTTIPSGQITAKGSFGLVCPILQAWGTADNAVISLINPSSQSILTQVIWSTDVTEVCNLPTVEPTRISEFATVFVPIPPCGSVNASIYVASIGLSEATSGFDSTWKRCATYNTVNLRSSINTYDPVNIQSSIVSTSATFTDAALAETYSVIVGMGFALTSMLQSFGFDQQILTDLLEQSRQNYLHSHTLVENAQSIADLTHFSFDNISDACSSEPCRLAREAFLNASKVKLQVANNTDLENALAKAKDLQNRTATALAQIFTNTQTSTSTTLPPTHVSITTSSNSGTEWYNQLYSTEGNAFFKFATAVFVSQLFMFAVMYGPLFGLYYYCVRNVQLRQNAEEEEQVEEQTEAGKAHESTDDATVDVKEPDATDNLVAKNAKPSNEPTLNLSKIKKF
jgi:hypothetical protein